ncbi:MAG: hypothetical protein FJW14_11265 [Acidimicrobiia bacterium]|nr:hypothetical protein [Acidimicrobiia bacterium]
MLTGRDVFEFGDVRVDLRREEVTRAGQPALLEPKTFEVLRYLIEHRDRLVTKEELLDTVWKDVFVTPNVLTRAIAQVRKALGDEAQDSRYIETVPKRGYRFIAGVRPRYEATQGSDPGDNPTQPLDTPRVMGSDPIRRRWLWVAAVIVVAAAALTWWAWPAAAPAGPALRMDRITGSGDVIDAAISPDGRYVAYVRSAGGVQSLWVRQLQSGSAIELVPSTAVGYWGVAFSPDGTTIYYALKAPPPHADPGGTLFAIPVLGGTPRRVLTGIDSAVTFSPDGRRLAYLRVEPDGSGASALMVANADGTAIRPLASRRPPYFFAPSFFVAAAWSPDGERIATPVIDRNAGDTKLVTIDVADGSEDVVRAGLGAATSTTWLPDGSAILFSGRNPSAGTWGYGAQLWLQPYPAGPSRPITVDTAEYRNVTVSRDGRSIVSVGMDPIASLWTASLGGGAPSKLPSTRSDGVAGTVWAGDRLIYTGFDSGQAQLWTMTAAGTDRRQLTTDGWNAWPAVSPDGRTVCFASYRDGRSAIWRMDRDGHHARPLAEAAIPSNLAVTADGRSLLFTALHDGDRATFIMPIEGGTPALVAERLERAAPSPDGKYVAGLWRATVLDALELVVMPLHGGTPIHRFPSTDSVIFTNSGMGNVAWAPDGGSVYATTAERTDIWRQRLAGGPLERVTNFLDGGIFGFAVSPDGRSLIVSRGPNLRDAFLITGFRQARTPLHRRRPSS